jgi:hypothetical protein
VATGVPTSPVKAAGELSTESIVIGGSVSNSAIYNTVNKQGPAVLAAMTKTFADLLAATTEARSQAEAKAAELATKLGFTSAVQWSNSSKSSASRMCRRRRFRCI